MTDYAKWLAEKFRTSGRKKTDLAAAIQLAPSAISKILAGDRDVSAAEFAAMQRWFGETISPQIYPQTGLRNIPIIGKVAAGIWREISMEGDQVFDVDEFPFPPDPRYPIESQFDLIVEGSSLNRIAQNGSRLRCIDLHKSGLTPRDGDIVIVRRVKDSFGVEMTAKRLKITERGQELWPDSTDPQWQTPLIVGAQKGEEITIIGIAVYTYQPMSRL